MIVTNKLIEDSSADVKRRIKEKTKLDSIARMRMANNPLKMDPPNFFASITAPLLSHTSSNLPSTSIFGKGLFRIKIMYFLINNGSFQMKRAWILNTTRQIANFTLKSAVRF